MIRSIPIRRPTIFTHFVADVLDATKNGMNFAANASVLGSELAGKALAVAKAPVDDQPGEPLAVSVMSGLR
jgi:hypothetical protein